MLVISLPVSCSFYSNQGGGALLLGVSIECNSSEP